MCMLMKWLCIFNSRLCTNLHSFIVLPSHNGAGKQGINNRMKCIYKLFLNCDAAFFPQITMRRLYNKYQCLFFNNDIQNYIFNTVPTFHITDRQVISFAPPKSITRQWALKSLKKQKSIWNLFCFKCAHMYHHLSSCLHSIYVLYFFSNMFFF